MCYVRQKGPLMASGISGELNCYYPVFHIPPYAREKENLNPLPGDMGDSKGWNSMPRKSHTGPKKLFWDQLRVTHSPLTQIQELLFLLLALPLVIAQPLGSHSFSETLPSIYFVSSTVLGFPQRKLSGLDMWHDLSKVVVSPTPKELKAVLGVAWDGVTTRPLGSPPSSQSRDFSFIKLVSSEPVLKFEESQNWRLRLRI